LFDFIKKTLTLK